MVGDDPAGTRSGRSAQADLAGAPLQAGTGGVPSGDVSAGGDEQQAARQGTYRLLARLALSEVDAPLLESLRGMPLFGPALDEMGGPAGLGPLRADYTRCFLMIVPPYESVYLDESGMLNAATSGSVLGHYQELGFESDAARTTGAPDHLGLELGFMAHLAARALAAERIGQRAVAESMGAEQRHFLEGHLVRWAPLFGVALAEAAGTPFYRLYGEAVGRFVLGDLELVSAGDVR
jgi:TorA maturation chaperone TorD